MSIQLFYPENLLTYGEPSNKPQIDTFKNDMIDIILVIA